MMNAQPQTHPSRARQSQGRVSPLVLGDDYSIALSAADGARLFLTHNVRMWEVFQPDLRRRMREAEEARSTREQVEAALFELLPSGRAEMGEVAKELAIGLRTQDPNSLFRALRRWTGTTPEAWRAAARADL